MSFLGECAGWLRSGFKLYTDVQLIFEVRARDQNARGAIGLFGSDYDNGRPRQAVVLPILGAQLPSASLLRGIDAISFPVNAAGIVNALKPLGEWQRYVVVRNGTRVSATLNGTALLDVPVAGTDGWIGFRAEGTGFELRFGAPNYMPPGIGSGVGPPPLKGGIDAGPDVDGVYTPGKGVVLPKLRREVRPNYTAQAIAEKIEGVAILDCVVEIDGTVGKVRIIRSLDPRYGLDEEAVRAARQWRFEPGTVNGTPVPVRVTLELAFTLKR